MGAALLGGVGAAVFDSVAAAARLLRTNPQRTEPGPAAAIYPELLHSYRALYPALAPQFARSAAGLT
jgi:ribulose kinase